MSDTGQVPPAAWFAGIAPEAAGFTAGDQGKIDMQAYFTNRGYDKLDANNAFASAVKSYRDAEKLIGAAPGDMLKMPKDAADVDGWTRFDTRVGVPADGKYDFSTVKFADGSEVEQGFIDALAPALKAAHVGKDAAPSLVKAIIDMADRSDVAEAQDYAQKLNTERESLKINWGQNYEVKLQIAQNTAKALGVDPAAISALEKTIGYAKVMEMMSNIGSKIGEDKFVNNGGGGNGGMYSADQATARLDALQKDQTWVNRLNNSDADAVKEFHMLTTIINEARRRVA